MLHQIQFTVTMPTPINVAHFLAQQADQSPSKAAIRAPAGKLTDGDIRYRERSFKELDSDVSATSHYLTARGIARGTRVLLMVRPGLDLIRIVFALFHIGAVPVVIDPGMGLRQFLRCVKHSHPDAVIGIPTAILVSKLFRPSFRGVVAKIQVGRSFESKIHAFRKDGSFPMIHSAEDELAAILFTSGSTGPAKGVCYTHGMFAAQVELIRAHYKIEPGEVDLPMLPIFALFNPAMGMCTVVPEMNPSRPATVEPEKIVRAIQQNAVTNSFGSPVLWDKITRYCETNKIELPTIRRILMAGAPVPPGLMRRMSAIIPYGEVHSPYGATEALPVSSISASEVLGTTAEETSQGAGTCVGVPLPGVDVRILQATEGSLPNWSACTELPTGSIGEIVARGPSVTRNYDNRPDADAGSKIEDDGRFWHRLGDLGYLDDKGRLWFCGRKAEAVMTEKGTLYTDCCEALFNTDPQVFRSALIDLGKGCPAIVVEPEKGMYPKGATAETKFEERLRAIARSHEMTNEIDHFFFEKFFPVDVRHNAKIHRLSLAKKFGRAFGKRVQ